MNEKEVRVLFLDVDGVLNCDRTTTKCGGYMGVDADKCALLREAVVKSDAKVVLSSTWRKHQRMLPYLWEHLGCEVQSRLIGETPVLDERIPASTLYRGHTRGDEIKAWLDANPAVKTFVILDDDTRLGELKPHHVQTFFADGMTEQHAAEIIKRLSPNEPRNPDVNL